MQWFQRQTKELYKLVRERLSDKDVELVEVTRGHYKGVRFYYGFVRFAIQEGSDQPKLQYEYFTLDNPKQRDIRSQEFQTLVGDILVDLIQSSKLSNHFVDLSDTGEHKKVSDILNETEDVRRAVNEQDQDIP